MILHLDDWLEFLVVYATVFAWDVFNSVWSTFPTGMTKMQYQ
jgi:hypothetical protein